MTLSTEHRNKVLINILNDAIIMERTNEGVNEILSAFNSECNWGAIDFYNSFCTAYILLGLYGDQYEDETELLQNSFFKFYREDFNKEIANRKSASELAKNIFVDWLSIVNRIETDKAVLSNC